MLGLIEKKRNGLELTPDEISCLIAGFGTGEVPDYQMSAFLMAAYFQGLSDAETLAMTKALLDSGGRWEMPAEYLPALDKHSTGGVGDKTTILLMPMLASLGLKAPKMAGRGLGYTGGTIDKLESIPGMRVEMTRDEAMAQLGKVGCFVISQSDGLVPAEKKLYALRDVTDTTAQEGLIISSILSKKIACGASHIIIDVKHGSGAFLQTEEQAMSFAKRIVRIGNRFGPRFAAAVTPMEQPLGEAVGNALEVAEVLRILEERDTTAEVMRLCAGLGGTLLLLCGRAKTQYEGEVMLAGTIADGRAQEKFKEFIRAQGGDLGDFGRAMEVIDTKAQRISINSPLPGHIRRIDALKIARFCHNQGAGRSHKGEAINPWVGIVFRRKVGDAVTEGDLLAEAYAKLGADIDQVQDEILGAFEVGDALPLAPLVNAVVI